MDILPNEFPLPNLLMNDREKEEFAEALSTRYVQLTALADVTKFLTDDPEQRKAVEDLHILWTIILDLPEDILAFVKQRVSL